jgi:hypothetical protein
MCVLHKLQPFDQAISDLYKAYCNACLNYWILSNSGKPVTIHCVAGINFCKAFAKHNIVNGVNVSEIYLCMKMFLMNMNSHPSDCQVTEPYKETVYAIIVPTQCT